MSSFCDFKRNGTILRCSDRAPSGAQNDGSIGWDQDLFNGLAVTDLVQDVERSIGCPISAKRSSNQCPMNVQLGNPWQSPASRASRSRTCRQLSKNSLTSSGNLAYSEMGLSHEGQDISNNVCLIRLIGKLWRRDMFKTCSNKLQTSK